MPGRKSNPLLADRFWIKAEKTSADRMKLVSVYNFAGTNVIFENIKMNECDINKIIFHEGIFYFPHNNTGQIEIYDSEKKEKLHTLQGKKNKIFALVAQNDGLLVCDENNQISDFFKAPKFSFSCKKNNKNNENFFLDWLEKGLSLREMVTQIELWKEQ
jgi:hypothetical protein